jgi:hypothetical protein
MQNSPSLWLSKSRKECCDKYFGYAYNECMGISAVAVGWYPAWAHSDNEAKCLNDNHVPNYMRQDEGTWILDDVASCCERYYDYSFDECITASGGSSIAPVYKFYPAWAINEYDAKCINGTDAPGYMKKSPNLWLFDDASSCCKRYYEYAGSQCLVDSGGTSSSVATNKWYVDYSNDVCVKDCDDSNDAQCGGLAELWQRSEMFVDSDSCCKKKLHWVKRSECTP